MLCQPAPQATLARAAAQHPWLVVLAWPARAVMLPSPAVTGRARQQVMRVVQSPFVVGQPPVALVARPPLCPAAGLLAAGLPLSAALLLLDLLGALLCRQAPPGMRRVACRLVAATRLLVSQATCRFRPAAASRLAATSTSLPEPAPVSMGLTAEA